MRSVFLGVLAGLVLGSPASGAAPVSALVGDRSVVLHWAFDPEHPYATFHVDRAEGSGAFRRFSSSPVGIQGFADTTVHNGLTYRYRLVAAGGSAPRAVPGEVSVTPAPFPDQEAFLDYVQRCAWAYFWHEANPVLGLVRDRSTQDSPCSIAATGFGLSALAVGVDRGWVSRERAVERARNTLRFFLDAPQSAETNRVTGYRGWFYHFLDFRSGHRVWRCELSSIDTAWLLAGVLDVREFFDGREVRERELRDWANQLLGRVDWAWMAQGQATLSMGWHPETGFIASRWEGYNEAMFLYLLGLGREVPGLISASWPAWCRTYRWATHYGQSFIEFAPLFGHQYSHCWVDFRGLCDAYTAERGLDYFENSRRATLAQQAYGRDNPGGLPGYSERVWGWTACDGPGGPGYHSYMARGAPPAENDDGTLAPTAAGGSVPFAPEVCLPTLRHFYDTYRASIWRPYGFCDAFNLKAQWWAPDVLGIDQGPILLMLENHRSGRVWQRLMRAPEIRRGLERAGFKAYPTASRSVR